MHGRSALVWLVGAAMVWGLVPGASAAGVWTQETVWTNWSNRNVMELDAAGYPHVAFQGYGVLPPEQQPVYYAKRDAAAWGSATQVLAGASNYGMVVGASNQPSVVAAASGQLLHAFPGGAGWTAETITNGASDYENISIAVHPNGNVAAAYIVPQSGIHYAERSGGVWQSGPVIQTGTTSFYGMKVNGAGTPAIVYRDNAEMLCYTYRSGSVWTTELVVAVGRRLDWGFDASQRCHVVYEEDVSSPAPCSQLRHAYRTNVGWQVETLATNSAGVYKPSLAARADGTIAVAYYEGTRENLGLLRYATKTGATWAPETASSAAGYSGQADLALDSAGYPHVAFPGYGGDTTKYAHRSGFGWTEEAVKTDEWNQPNTIFVRDNVPPTIHLRAMTVTYAQRQDQWWDESVAMGGNWQWNSWLGFFNVHYAPWIYHQQHDWMYSIGDTAGNVWYWTTDMGWLWTAEGVYPAMYRLNDASWLWYLSGTDNPRWFADLTNGGWEEH